MKLDPGVTVLVAGLTVVTAQQSGWQEGQESATMCFWEQPRAAVIKDRLFIDGGDLWWLPGFGKGQYGDISSDDNPLSLIYTLDFSKSFSTSQNISALLGTIAPGGGGGAGNNQAPNYYDGALLGNDHELYFYGGALRPTDQWEPPRSDDVLKYEDSQYGVERSGFRPGFTNGRLPDGLTRYITYGGAASAPSENKAWYFSGSHSPSWGPIAKGGGNHSLNALNVSDTLIQLDMATQLDEKWSNFTLPNNVSGRANPSLVWIPVGAQGLLVTLGGVIYPDFDTSTLKSQNEPESKSKSPTFMSTIDVYDVANKQWYSQPADGAPGQLTRGCAVLATAEDYSSFNIYYYGGYDGIHHSSAFNDDVWVLSLPSFAWFKVATGNDTHGRAGHQCVAPYPDQMFVVGGYNTQGSTANCLENGILQVFNLTSAQWQTSYDPSVYGKYGVPEMIHRKIGGGASGGATVTTPISGWVDKGLERVFATAYPTSKLVTHYPYASPASPSSTGSTGSAPGYDHPSKDNGLPRYLPPLLGVICGLIGVTAIVVAIILYRRRKLWNKRGGSDGSTDENGRRVFNWLRGQAHGDGKSVTVTTATDETPMTPDPYMTAKTPEPPAKANEVMAEMEGSEISELPGTHIPHELHGTGLTHFNPGGYRPTASSLHHSPSYSSRGHPDHASIVSRGSEVPAHAHSHAPSSTAFELAQPGSPSPPLSDIDQFPSSPTSIAGSPAPTPAPASPLPSPAALASSGPTPQRHPSQQQHSTPAASPRGESGVSGISDSSRTHLRQISDGTVSSLNTTTDAAAARGGGGDAHPHSRSGRSPTPTSHPRPSESAMHTGGGLMRNIPEGGTTSTPTPTHPLVSPPTPPPGSIEGEDYLYPRRLFAGGSSLRRSMFEEDLDHDARM